MKWVTWQNVGVDRMGCAWLIRRHLDPKAWMIKVGPGPSIAFWRVPGISEVDRILAAVGRARRFYRPPNVM